MERLEGKAEISPPPPPFFPQRFFHFCLLNLKLPVDVMVSWMAVHASTDDLLFSFADRQGSSLPNDFDLWASNGVGLSNP